MYNYDILTIEWPAAINCTLLLGKPLGRGKNYNKMMYKTFFHEHLVFRIWANLERLDSDRQPRAVNHCFTSVHCSESTLAKLSIEYNLVSWDFPFVKAQPWHVLREANTVLNSFDLCIISKQVDRTTSSRNLFQSSFQSCDVFCSKIMHRNFDRFSLLTIW